MNVQQFLGIKKVIENEENYTIYTDLIEWKGLNGNKPKSFTTEIRHIRNRELVRVEYMRKCSLIGDIVNIETADCIPRTGKLYNERKYFIPVENITHFEVHKLKEVDY